MSIVVEHVTKIYGEQKALNDVSFSIEPGEIVGFLGPNGAGKSTMMKIISCFIPPSEGVVKVCGYDVNEQAIEIKRKVGYLPEHNPLYLEMYVKEYLEFIAGLHKVKNPTERVAEMINLVGLQIEQRKKIGALSKGYRQRVGLAQAMIHDPEVLILDEPTSGLDPNQLTEIRGLIKEIGKQKTVMLSTHIMQEVEAICDRVMIINGGIIVANDKAKDLQQNNKENIVVIEFDRTIPKELISAIKGVNQLKDLGNNSWAVSSSEDVRNQLFQLAVSQAATVLGMRQESKTLEEVFKELTKS